MVRCQIEHRLSVSVQAGCVSPGFQLGQVVFHDTSIDIGDDDSYEVVVKELEGFPLAFLRMLLSGNFVVDVPGFVEGCVHRSPATGAGVLPAQVPGQLVRLVIAYLFNEHTQALLRRIIAHANGGQDREDNDEDY